MAHDHRALLIRYIRHIRSCEGVDFITTGSHQEEDSFSPGEWRELTTLADLNGW